MPRNDLIQLRSDTAANWASVNPTLAVGETGFETDTGKFKIGTGSTAWNSLLYATDASEITGSFPSLTVTGNVNVDSGTLYVDVTNNRVGINRTNPSQPLDVLGNAKIVGNAYVDSGLLDVRTFSIFDGVRIQGRSGGTSGYAVTLTPDTLTTNRTLTLPNADGTAALVEPLIRTSANLNGAGTWWRSPFVPYPNVATSNLFALGAGTSVPYAFDKSVTISEIGFLTSPSNASNTTARVAIYKTETSDNAPTTKIYESSDVTLTGTNQQVSITGLSVNLTPGIYWFFVFNSNTGTMALNCIASNLGGTVHAYVPYTSMTNALTQANTGGTWGVSFNSNTAPATLLPLGAGTSATSPGSNWPRMAIRRSA